MLTMTKDEVLEHDDSSLADGTILMSLPLMPPIDTGESGVSGMKSLEDDLDEMVKEEDDVDVNHMLSVVNAGGSKSFIDVSYIIHFNLSRCLNHLYIHVLNSNSIRKKFCGIKLVF